MTDEPFFEYDFGSKWGKKSFSDQQSAVEFIKDQISGYEWLARSGANQTQQYLINVYYNNLVNSVHIAQDANAGNKLAKLAYQFDQIYKEGRLPLVGSGDFDFVDQVRTSKGETAAAAALSYICERMSQLQLADKDVWTGILLAFNRDEGLGKGSASAAKVTFDRLTNRLKNKVEEFEIVEKSRDETFNHVLMRQLKRNRVLLKWQTRGYERRLKDNQAQIASSIDEINKVRATYEELMKLRAPVDYWTEKAKHHRNQATSYKNIGLSHGWKVAAGLTSVLCVIGGIGFFSATPDRPSSAYLFLITIGLVITTMAFWATRILVRLYMSEHHLAIDADERATMALTYLALMERGAVEEKDRALILAPLFRPSSDGIVKDDAAPDMSPAGLLSKAMNK